MSRAVTLVGVAGGSGSGKSWLAGRLLQWLSPLVLSLSVDDFYRDRSTLPPARRAQLNFDHPAAIDWHSLEKVLACLTAGKTAVAPIYDFRTHSRIAVQSLMPKPIILLEGLWVWHRASLRNRIDLRVFVKCSERVRLQRRLERDVQQRSRTARSIVEQFRTTVAPMHDRHVEPQARHADVLLDSPVQDEAVANLAGLVRGRACRFEEAA